MIIELDKNLKNQRILANGTELASIMGFDRKKGKRILTHKSNKKVYVHTFRNPVLMTDFYKISKLSPTLRDTIFSLYNSRPRIVSYDGVSTSWDESHKGVWCPSIDTLLFARAISKIVGSKKIKKAAEIGCGSGFLSKYILSKNKHLKSMLINDLNPYSIKSAMDNIKDVRAEFYAGDGIKKIREKKFDLLICNPPYVPRPNSIDDNPYEGVGLLYHLIHDGQKYLNPNGILILNISSLSKKIIFSKKPKMKMKIIDEMTVPLKVNNILNNKLWIKYLVKNGLKKNYHNGYEYWQKLEIVMLTN